MITTDNPARPINTHILKLPNLSMRFPGGWIERSEDEAVVALWAATIRLLRTGNPDKWPF
jgi:hypothetical protein